MVSFPFHWPIGLSRPFFSLPLSSYALTHHLISFTSFSSRSPRPVNKTKRRRPKKLVYRRQQRSGTAGTRCHFYPSIFFRHVPGWHGFLKVPKLTGGQAVGKTLFSNRLAQVNARVDCRMHTKRATARLPSS